MKKVAIIIASVLLILGMCHIACAKPLKIENSFGQLVRCGEWKNTKNAIVIRDCPELAAMFDLQPEPTLTPIFTPTPTPVVPLTPSPTHEPITCEYRFIETGEGLKLETVFPVGQIAKTCVYMGPETLGNLFVELNSINRSNAFCPIYELNITSPNGTKYEWEASRQPGGILYPEVGTWQINVFTVPGSECSRPMALQLLIRTK